MPRKDILNIQPELHNPVARACRQWGWGSGFTYHITVTPNCLAVAAIAGITDTLSARVESAANAENGACKIALTGTCKTYYGVQVGVSMRKGLA